MAGASQGGAALAHTVEGFQLRLCEAQCTFPLMMCAIQKTVMMCAIRQTDTAVCASIMGELQRKVSAMSASGIGGSHLCAIRRTATAACA